MKVIRHQPELTPIISPLVSFLGSNSAALSCPVYFPPREDSRVVKQWRRQRQGRGLLKNEFIFYSNVVTESAQCDDRSENVLKTKSSPKEERCSKIYNTRSQVFFCLSYLVHLGKGPQSLYPNSSRQTHLAGYSFGIRNLTEKNRLTWIQIELYTCDFSIEALCLSIMGLISIPSMSRSLSP